jgi:hypothetical protein
MDVGRAIGIWNLIAAPLTEVPRIKERVMAKVIEFYVPQRVRNSFVRAAQPQPGKVIEFCSHAKKSAQTRPAGGVLEWLLVPKEWNHVVGRVVGIDELREPSSTRRTADAVRNVVDY